MAFTGFDDDFGVADFLDLAREHRAQLLAHARVNPTGPAVGYDALLVQRAEVSASRNVAGSQLQAQAERLDDAAPDLELERVITEQRQVARAAAWRDARRYRQHSALSRAFAERVEVWRGRRFQRRQVALLPRREIAYSIQNHQHQLGSGFQGQFRIQSVQLH